jgi:hypothetical protein
MTTEEIAKKFCEYWYLKQKESGSSYSFGNYWEVNKTYFIERAEIYLEVKECVE